MLVNHFMQPLKITDEAWREYDFAGRVYRIENPQLLFIGTTTHRVVDAQGVVHCVPVPGSHGCVLRWQARNKKKPVLF